MPGPAGLRFRAAAPGDANAIAGLHADSWRRNYRGAFSDAFLDHDVAGYLLPLWTERLASPDPRARTILAELGAAVVGVARPVETPSGPPIAVHLSYTWRCKVGVWLGCVRISRSRRPT